MDKPIKPKRYKYLSNHNLIAQIVKSKNSYAEWVDPQYKVDPDAVINCVGKSVTEALEGQPQTVGRIVRVVTWDHIPLAPDRKRRGTEKNTTHERLNMLPFQVFTRDQEAWRCVAKSHWTGGIGNGHFEAIPRRARMTDELGKMMIKLADNISTKGNWSGYSYLDEMKALAVMTLIEHGLKFDETVALPNPFAYYTTTVTNAFIKVLNAEAKVQAIRDDMLEDMGATPSMKRQLKRVDEPIRARPAKKGLPTGTGRPVGRPRKVSLNSSNEAHTGSSGVPCSNAERE